MLKKLKSIDLFARNVVVVFVGTSLFNLLNLLFQLLIAHKLPASDFAAFNSLLAILMIISAPLATIQMGVAKYVAEFKAYHQLSKVKLLLSGFFRRASFLAILTFLLFSSISFHIINMLKISSPASGYILAALLAFSWLIPVLLGGVQGLELFKWYTSGAVLTGILKLGLGFVLVLIGCGVAGALGALLFSMLAGQMLVYLLALRGFILLKHNREPFDYSQITLYLVPVAISSFCFMGLVNFDMVLVKYFFSQADSGIYSLAQMTGKIFLFLPLAVSTVMFPKTSGLSAKNAETLPTLKRSLFYVLGLCFLAACFYNLFPEPVLRILTGKAYPESILLGRLFSISMSAFTLLYILIFYFLSIKNLRFIKYLVFFTLLQNALIFVFHQSLISVQLILCINSIVLVVVHLMLIYRRRGQAPYRHTG